MKSVFLSMVILLTCGGCVIGDLEFYPDYKRSDADVLEEEWVHEPQPSSDLQRYLQEVSRIYRQDRERSSFPYGAIRRIKPNKEVVQSWPNTIARHLLNNKDLALRLLNRHEKPQEPSRKHQYFKILPSGRDPNARLSNLFDTKEGAALLSLFKPNRGDVGFNEGDEDSDFNTSYDEDGLTEEEEPHDVHEHGQDEYEHDEHEYNEQGPNEHDHNEHESDEHNHGADNDQQKHNEGLAPIRTTYDVEQTNPDVFGITPSDPRFFNMRDISQPVTGSFPNHVNAHEGMEVNDIGRSGNKQNNALDRPEDEKYQSDDVVDVVTQKSSTIDESAGVYIIAVVAGISAAATVGLIAFGIGWYNLQKHVKNASDVDYPAYGITGPNKDISPSGDRRLAQSAQMYHYQHQKQQIIAMERAAANERHGSVSEAESDEENEEGDYTVYECPGLAPTGEMEVKNPLFQDDPTPAQTPAVKSSEDGVAPKK